MLRRWKRIADAMVAAEDDVENLEKSVEPRVQSCHAIPLSIIQDDAIKNMSAEMEREITKTENFVGTPKVHQITEKLKRY